MSKWFATLLLFFAMPALSFNSDVIQENQAMEHLNQDVTLCGLVKQVSTTRHATHLNLGGIYPNHKLSFAISKEFYTAFLAKFGNFNILQNKKMCAKGLLVQDYKGRLQINVEDPHVLRFMK